VCHQPTGKGIPNQFPPLAESDWVAQAGPGRLIRLVLDGVQGPIKVNGVDWNNAMPPWKELLKDEDIAAVLTYVRQNKAWGNSAGPVTPEQVKAVREKEAARSTAWSGDELMAIPDTQ
jgi:mono/diheme cytochrome c family protein